MVSKFPSEIVVMEAQREYRLHQYLWHQIMNSWLSHVEKNMQRAWEAWILTPHDFER